MSKTYQNLSMKSSTLPFPNESCPINHHIHFHRTSIYNKQYVVPRTEHYIPVLKICRSHVNMCCTRVNVCCSRVKYIWFQYQSMLLSCQCVLFLYQSMMLSCQCVLFPCQRVLLPCQCAFFFLFKYLSFPCQCVLPRANMCDFHIKA